jgi:uncharacterized protein (TIGR02246 family)
MDTRASIESLLDKIYAARRSGDAQAAAACFADDGAFAVNAHGMAVARGGRTEQETGLKGMFEAFELLEFKEHCRIIDPPGRAVVHWRGTFRTQNGKVGEGDILDLIEIDDGKIASLTTFFDTAYAASLSAPG